MRLRTSGTWGRGRPTATVVLVALIPVAALVPALAALALVAVVCATLIAYEAIRYRHARSWIRSHRGEFTTEGVSRIASVTGARPPIHRVTTSAQDLRSLRPGRLSVDGAGLGRAARPA